MAEITGISWAHATFNPWIGCTALSPACDFCYAKTLVNGRMGGDFGLRRRTSAANWRQSLRWNRQAAEAGVRRRVFCASLADVFDNRAPDGARADLWDLIRVTPHLDWMLLTKRPQNIAKMLPPALPYWPNVWLGTTVENQKEADRRIPQLRAVPAVVHFLSMEPLLGPVVPDLRDIEWVITGGESGSKARPTDPVWVRSIRDACAAAAIPFHHKQWGSWDADALRCTDTAGCGPPPNMRIGVKRSGRLLDGVLHDAFPEVRHVAG